MMDLPDRPSESATRKRNSTRWREDAPVSFSAWSQALEESGLPSALRTGFRRAILGFLKHCKSLRCPASIGVANTYLAQQAGQEYPGAKTRDGLRWFFIAAQGSTEPEAAPFAGRLPATSNGPLAHGAIPPLSADDLGESNWEAALIREIRTRGLLWRTEQTYRGFEIRGKRGVNETQDDPLLSLENVSMRKRMGWPWLGDRLLMLGRRLLSSGESPLMLEDWLPILEDWLLIL
jgi:hypothetical protein